MSYDGWGACPACGILAGHVDNCPEETGGKQVSSDYAVPEKRTYSLPFTWEQLVPPRAPKSKTWVDVDPDQLAAYNDWYLRYDAIVAEGRTKNWLFQGYEGDELTPPAGKWVYEYESDQ